MREVLNVQNNEQKKALKKRLSESFNGYDFALVGSISSANSWNGDETVYSVMRNGRLKGLISVPSGNSFDKAFFQSVSGYEEGRDVVKDLQYLFHAERPTRPAFFNPNFGSKRLAYEMSKDGQEALGNLSFLAEFFGPNQRFETSSSYTRGSIRIIETKDIRIRLTTKKSGNQRRYTASFISLSPEMGLSSDFIEAVVTEAEERPVRIAEMVRELGLKSASNEEVAEFQFLLKLDKGIIFPDEPDEIQVKEGLTLYLGNQYPEFRYNGRNVLQMSSANYYSPTASMIAGVFLERLPEMTLAKDDGPELTT